MSFIGGLAGAGIGGALSMILFAPLTAVNNFLGSYYFGSGMILGEREMYQQRWVEIKKELDAGRSFIDVLEEVMKESTQGVMNTAERTLTQIKPQWESMVANYMQSLAQNLKDALHGDDIQKLIEFYLNINQDGSTTPTPDDPVPEPDPEKTEPTFPNIDRPFLEAMTKDDLVIARNDALHGLYSPLIKELVLLVYEERFGAKQEEEATIVLRTQLWLREAEMLKELIIILEAGWEIARFYSDFITQFSGEQQSIITSDIQWAGIQGAFSTRSQTQSSDQRLSELRQELTLRRQRFLVAIGEGKTGSTLNPTQEQLNSMHIVIALWQLVYSR